MLASNVILACLRVCVCARFPILIKFIFHLLMTHGESPVPKRFARKMDGIYMYVLVGPLKDCGNTNFKWRY